ncbi:MAG: hypothetical protein PWQ64_660 [Desulfomicrobiaceae bacterium]|jgi:predicted PurR-regulated permease PerM|nr:hypothetical protein [Desulfomicrobiaceae bacterium]MDK2872896.1 hypothetical protein [Desulfomicrobiaceae bacterium]
MLGHEPWTFDRTVRLALVAAVIWGAVRLLGALSDAIIPFLMGLLFAYVLDPVVRRVEVRVRSRQAAIAVVLLGAVVTLILAGALFTPMIAREVTHMARLAQEVLSNSRLAAEAAKRLPPDIWEAVRGVLASPEVQDFLRSDSVFSIAQGMLRRIVPGIMGLISGAYSMVMAVAVVLVIGLYTVFLLLDFESLRQRWHSVLPTSWRQPILEFLAEFDSAMSRYFRGQALVAGTVGILFAIGFSLIGLPLAVVLGLFLGLLNMVPYLQTVGFVPAVLLAGVHALETGTSFWTVLGLVLVVFAVVQAIQDMVLVPRFLGKAMGLSPAWILLSLSIWGSLLGFLGLLLALPLTCLLFAYWRRLIASDEGARLDNITAPL